MKREAGRGKKRCHRMKRNVERRRWRRRGNVYERTKESPWISTREKRGVVKDEVRELLEASL